VIARIERGSVEPGLPRLAVLLRVYDLSLQVAGELAEVEQLAGELPADPLASYEEAVERWKAGDMRRAMAHLLVLMRRSADESANRLERQKTLLTFAITAGSLGKYRLSRQILDELLLDPLNPELLVSALAQLATCWHWLGSGEVALALLARAEIHLQENDPQKRAWVLHNRASTLVSLGRFDEARREIDRAREAYRAARDSYGEGRVQGVLVRLHIARGEFEQALRTTRAAEDYARENKHERLSVMRKVDEGRILLALDRAEAAVDTLNMALAGALSAKDEVCQFHAHFYLWKAYTRRGEAQRADLELRAAEYFVRFLDDETPETAEIRRLRNSRASATEAHE
jgi:tetratricopeptide (TPR) repeat protein